MVVRPLFEEGIRKGTLAEILYTKKGTLRKGFIKLFLLEDPPCCEEGFPKFIPAASLYPHQEKKDGWFAFEGVGGYVEVPLPKYQRHMRGVAKAVRGALLNYFDRVAEEGNFPPPTKREVREAVKLTKTPIKW